MSEKFSTKTHIRHCLLYEFQLCRNAIVAVENLRKANGDKALSVSQCQRWFAKFRKKDFSVEDEPRPGQPPKVDNEVLRQLIESDPKQTLEDMSIELKCDPSTIWRHLKQIGKVFKARVWIPHQLNANQQSVRITISAHFSNKLFLLKRNGFCMKILNEVFNGLTLVKPRYRRPKLVSTQKRPCYVYGGIIEV